MRRGPLAPQQEERDYMNTIDDTSEPEEAAGPKGVGAPAAPSAARSPFGPRGLPGDGWIGRATYGLVVAIVVVGAYLAWSYYSDYRLASTQSPAARAVANLARGVAANPSNAQARVTLAEAMMANGQSDQAIEQLKAALGLDKENVAALSDLGLIAMDRGEWKTAESYWLQLVTALSAAELSSQDNRLADVYYYLGTTLVEEQRYEEAIVNLKQSVVIKRDSSPVHYTLAVAYQRLRLPEMQRQELGIVLAFDPRHAQANYDMGMMAVAASEVATSAEFFRIAADNAPSGVAAPQDQLDTLGSAGTHLTEAARLQSTDAAKALSEARIAAAIDPKSADAVRLVATLSEKIGDKTRARNAWERYLEMVPDDSTAAAAIKRLTEEAK